MTAISTVSPTGSQYRRAGTAQANTGQTDWIVVPDWARYADIILNVTAVAGTTPAITPDLLAADPVALDDGSVASIVADAGNFTTAVTDVGTHRIQVGPGVSGIADDVTLAATGDSSARVNALLPAILGVRLTLDRGDANETYTYTLTVRFLK